MINELYGLAKTLESKGVVTTDWHREYKLLPKVSKLAPCIRIWLTKNGVIDGFENTNEELVQSLRKFGNNQSTFPAFNIAPLYRITDQNQLDMLEQIERNFSLININEIRSWCVTNNWGGSLSRKINNCIHGAAHRLLTSINGSKNEDFLSIIELIRISDSFSEKYEHDFKYALERCIFEKLQRQEDVHLALSILFYRAHGKTKDSQKDNRSISIILDIKDWKQYGYPVASKYVTERINEQLIRNDHSIYSNQVITKEIDAFGTQLMDINEPMPNVRLKGFDVTLRTMFAGQPCQWRYGTIENTSYPIARENRALIKKSFEWIADQNREGISWQRVDKDQIVFVYPSRLPEIPLKFVSVFGPRMESKNEHIEAQFEHVSEEFIKTFKGIPLREKPDYIQIFTIQKIDKARSRVVFTRNCTPEQLINAAEQWKIGCRNVPELRFAKQRIPFPLQIARIINKVWKQNGESLSSIQRVKYYQGLELLLDPPQESLILTYLNILLINSFGLVKYVGNWDHGGGDRPKRVTDSDMQGEEIIIIMSLLGLLLHKLDVRKEKYMENTAYLVGQLLKISDELHALYCKIVRNGNIPPQLVGSSMFIAASENPIQTLSQLAVRMNPYISWAKQYRTKDVTDKGIECWRASWYLGLYESTVNKLCTRLSGSMHFSDFDKAQLFIGYLASFPKKEKNVESIQIENPIIEWGGTNEEQ